MKVIIAGSRDGITEEDVKMAIVISGFKILEVISGRAPRGADRYGEQWARENGTPVKPFPADWEKYGKTAGFVRNQLMAEYAQALIAGWDGYSKGTRDMVTRARTQGLKVFVYNKATGVHSHG